MSECGDVGGPLTLWEEIRYWVERFWSGTESRRCLCGWHQYGPWQARPTTGFNIAGQLVAGTEHFRRCARCKRIDAWARAN